MTKIDLTDSLEKIAVKIFASPTDGSAFVAQQIADLIKQKEKEGKKTVIGLATGSSPKTLYAHLVRMHKEEGLSFKNVITFNLDSIIPWRKMRCKVIITLCGRIYLNIRISIRKIITCPMD